MLELPSCEGNYYLTGCGCPGPPSLKPIVIDFVNNYLYSCLNTCTSTFNFNCSILVIILKLEKLFVNDMIVNV